MQTLRAQSAALPSGLRTLVSQIVEAPQNVVVSDATTQIESLYNQQVVPVCNNLIANRYPFASSPADVQLSDFGAVFGYDGLFDKFFTEHLAKQVDMTGATWTWRPGSITPSQQLLTQFQAAQRIRDLFFPAGAKTPSLKFFVTFSDVDATASRFVLQVDGQYADNLHSKQQMLWPGPTPGSAATSWESRYYDPTKSYGGPWAWFRMVDDTRVGSPDALQRVLLNIQNRYHRVHVTVEGSSVTSNPFASWDWRQFSCES